MRASGAAAAVAAFVLAVSACTAGGGATSGSASASASAPPEPVVARAPDPSILPSQTLGTPPTMRIAAGVVPPTNRWYSSLAMGDVYQPIFPTPLSWTPAADGFSFGLPRVTESANAIFGSSVSDVTVTVGAAVGGPTVVAADPVAVTAAWADDAGDELARVTLAEGWPVVGLTATKALTLTFGAPLSEGSGGWWSVEVGGVEYGVLPSKDGTLTGGTSLAVPAAGNVQMFAVPSGGDAASFAAALTAPITGVTTTYDGTSTSLTYEGATSTVLAVPTSRHPSPGMTCDLGSFDTINGTLSVCRGTKASWTSSAVKPTSALDLSGISDGQRAAIAAALKEDVAATPTLPGDSYFGSKALYRLANLFELAKSLGEDDIASDLLSQLSAALREWAEPTGCVQRTQQCFVYDPAYRGVVGMATAFGSEDFNDHHFHYGYLLYAAGVAAAQDHKLSEEIAPVMNLVAADIASATTTADFPELRVFDPYSGHSWASGVAPFADGNNQESSSEAASAWNGLAVWADARGDSSLAGSARWMLASESDSAVKLWVRPDLSAYPAFDHQVVGIQWSGKRDFATWFSPEPSAVLGIQLIPMPPSASEYLAPADPAAAALIRSTVAEATPDGFGVQFGDYLLMYLALAGKPDAESAWDQARKLPATSIDDANSRSYMLAWIASRM